MQHIELRCFKHLVDGKVYAGWYAVMAPNDLEVLGVGMLERVWFKGSDPEPVARSVLEDFVRRRMRTGQYVPTLEETFAADGR